MNTYHKIQSIFKRDPQNNNKTFLLGQYSTPEIEFLKDNEWEFTEKIDGTNIRNMWGGESITFQGKTDNSAIPSHLVNELVKKFLNDEMNALMRAQFGDEGGVCLYGEGCGPKIQKGGGNYGPAPMFVLFDVKIGEWWLKREDVADVAANLGLPLAPVIGRGTLQDAIEMTREGFNSKWGDFIAEGIVARPVTELFSRNGQRVITKIKHKDFKK